MTYRTALILGLICQSIGVLAFGPLAYPAYGGFLTQQNMLELYPGLCMYAMMWIVVTPVIWQALAIWQVVLVPAYLGTGALRWARLHGLVCALYVPTLCFPAQLEFQWGAASHLWSDLYVVETLSQAVKSHSFIAAIRILLCLAHL